MNNEGLQLHLLYHFFHPDDVISARLFSDLAESALQHGHRVSVMPSVRSCHDGEAAYPKRENWKGVEIHRVWRPDWKQGSNRGRVGNTIAMLAGWTWRALWTRRSKNETVVIGTDPPLGVLIAIPWRLFRPRARIIHWCHDLYPHAAVAEGVLSANSWAVRGLNVLMRVAYARCDVIADLGPCMRHELRVASGDEKQVARRKKLGKQEEDSSPPTPPRVLGRGQEAKYQTLTPWALVEPESVLEADTEVRRELFGHATLGLLYSGNLGRAHVYQTFVELARRVTGDPIAFCFAGRGPLLQKLEAGLVEAKKKLELEKRAVSGELGVNTERREQGLGTENIRFAGFASEELLAKRLGAADVHMVSLAPSWTGAVVPSKFFGALAVGRPVLFAGSRKSAIARWVDEFDVGWVLDDDASVKRVAEQLSEFAADPRKVKVMREHCFEVYKREFSKAVQMEKWNQTLKASS